MMTRLPIPSKGAVALGLALWKPTQETSVQVLYLTRYVNSQYL